MAKLSAQKITTGGLEPTYSAASSGGDEFTTTGAEFLAVKNGAGSSVDVTVASNNCQYGGAHDLTVTVPAGEERLIGPFPPSRFAIGGGDAEITYSSATSVTVAVLTV